MSKNYAAPPLNERFVDENGFITTVWKEYLSTVFQTNEGYGTQFGLLLPRLTTAQRDATIDNNDPDTYGTALNQDNIPSGLMFYNSDTDETQVYFGSTLGWRSVYTT